MWRIFSGIVIWFATGNFVSGSVYDSAPVTLESAVFKFPIGSGIIWIEGATLTTATTNYRPAIFTAADDNTAGTTLSTSIWSGYTGNPGTNIYGLTPLWLDAPAATNIVLNNLRFCYQFCCIAAGYGSSDVSLTVSDCQFANGVNGIILEAGNTFTENLNNCLFGNVEYPLSEYGSGLTANACNCTFDAATYLFYDGGSYPVTCNFTNSLFSSVATEFMPASPPDSSFVTNGAYNGFYSAATFGSSQTSVGSDPYQPVAAGNYYLPSDSPFLTAGTTNVGAALLAQLGMKTVFGPLFLTNAITENTVLSPVAQRDTAGPALGWHYDPIDYITACSVSNATLVLTNGVALAYYDNMGVWLQDGSQLVSQGAPNYRNYLVYYGLVQEQPVNLWGVTNAVARALPIAPEPYGSSANPSIYLRLTTLCAPMGETNLWNTADNGVTGQAISGLGLRDCEVYGAGANWQMAESNNTPGVGLTNNVFHRVPFAVSNNAVISCYNNLFYGTTNANEFAISIHYRTPRSPNIYQNNVFDGVQASLDDDAGYNVYLHGGTNTIIQANDIVTNLTWQAGPLGAYYQPANSPLLTNGSIYAAALALYHYTVLTNETVEGTNIVSRGYHYVALGTNGLPLDTSGNGPDYLLDVNGDGLVESGEIDWQLPGDMGLTVVITQPANNSQIP